MKKRILIINNNLNIGGAEKSLTALLPLLNEYYEIDLMLLEKKGELLETISEDINIIENTLYTEMMKGIKFHLKNKNFKIAKNLFLIKIFYKLIPLMSYKKFASYYICDLKTKKYDCVIGFLEGMSSLIASNIKSEKHIYWMHTDYEKQTIDKRAYAKLYKNATAIICVSNQAKKQLINIFPEIENHTFVVENIVNKEIIEKDSKAINVEFEKGKVHFLSVARLSYLKGHMRMLDVIFELKKLNKNFHWHFIGDGEDREMILARAKELDILEYCTFYGALVNPYPYIKACTYFMIPSLAEGFGMALTEALLLKKYSVATNFNGAKQQITSNNLKIGQVIDNNFKSILKTCLDLIDHPKQFEGEYHYDVSYKAIQQIKNIID